jgi:phosphate transport system substrate-binding protein
LTSSAADRPLIRRRLLPALLAVVAVLAGACSGGEPDQEAGARTVADAPGKNDRASLAGAGSTFAATMVEEWARLYRTPAPGVAIAYEPTGSVAGVRRVSTGAADFAVTEVPMSAEEQLAAGSGRAIQVPLAGGAVVVAYNLPGVEGLRLAEDTLARIFSGAVTRWDHPMVRRDNPDRLLPSTAVVAVHRSDASGTTQAFARYLATAGPAVWTAGTGASVDWPGGRDAVGSAGVVASVAGTAGAVGYVAAGPARAASLQLASLRNPAGSFVAPTPAAVDAALLGATGFADNLTLTVPPQRDVATAYPIAAISHLVFLEGLPAPKQDALRHFAEWVLMEGQRSTDRMGYAPLPLPLLVRTLEGVLGGGLQPRR